MAYLNDSRDRSALWGILGAYWCVLLLVLVVSRWLRDRDGKMGQTPLVQHYLASRSLGAVVTGLTLCASMFSGYTAVGIPAEAYSEGFSYIRWIGSCTFISLVLIVYGPRLHWLARRRGYVSVCDFVHDRYGVASPARSFLHWVLLLMLLVPCFVYLLAQFAAFSSTLNTISDGALPKWAAALIFAALLAVYETVGGLHAVALTDVVQGLVLVFGTISVWAFANAHYGGIAEIGRRVAEVAPGHVEVMGSKAMLASAEFWIVVGLQRTLFPDYQTRVLAAASQTSLRIGTAILIVAPFFVQVPLGLLGLIGRYEYGEGEKKNSIFAKVVVDIIERDGAGRVFGSAMLAASVAAIMSTADSVLIEVSKLITCDVLRPLLEAYRQRGKHGDGVPQDAADSNGSDRVLTWYGHLITAVLALVCVPLGTADWDLSVMIQFQGAILSATGPTYIYGLYWPKMRGNHAVASLAWGCTMGVYVQLFGEPGHLILVIVLNFLLTALVVLSDGNKEPETSTLDLPPLVEHCGAAALLPAPQREPVLCARTALVASVVLAFLSLPFYFPSDSGEALVGGYPTWAFTGLLFFGAAHLVQLGVVWRCWSDGGGSEGHGSKDDEPKPEPAAESSQEEAHQRTSP